MKQLDQFFAMQRERYKMLLRRRSRAEQYRPRPCPWGNAPRADGTCHCNECLLEREGLLTRDPVLSKWRFCNVFREDDVTTAWFRKNIREPMKDDPRVLLATIAFRWFNRIETGEKIKDVLLGNWDTQQVRRRLYLAQPVVTGAYMIKTPSGMDKLDGVCWCIDQAAKVIAKYPADYWYEKSLQQFWNALREMPLMGGFMAYEVVSDLRHTFLLREASDINTWANAGPGCTRGLGRVVHGDPNHWTATSEKDQKAMNSAMIELYCRSLQSEYWPSGWPKWEMREVEHSLCEWDKYCRGLAGDKLKRKYP